MITTFYDNNYFANTKVNSMRKLSLIAKELESLGLANFVSPQFNEKNLIDSLKRIHSEYYVDSFLTGNGELARSNELGEWSKEIRNGVLWSVAGTEQAARWAVNRKTITSSISQGFHHAKPNSGEALCTFNALALIASEHPNWKVAVLDCDEHEGNGTTEFCKILPNLYNFSIFATDFGGDKSVQNSRLYKVRGWAEYESALNDALMEILSINPDVIIYQAGMDCIKGDGLALADITAKESAMRDSIVFDFALSFHIPLAFVVAGGYGKFAVEHHVNTWKVARNTILKLSA